MQSAPSSLAITLLSIVLTVSTIAPAQKPDLHDGGSNPSSIPNHATITVTLPGFYLSGAKLTLSGAKLTVDGSCHLVNYTASDRKIVMSIAGDRALSDPDGYCNLHIATPAGKVSTWIVVNLTDEEEHQRQSTQRQSDIHKAQTVIARSGNKWTLHFENGATETYTIQPTTDSGIPLFSNSAGKEFKIIVGNDNKVSIFGDQCMRTGTFAQGRVIDGKSMDCTPTGAWTATMQ